jgi:hypothetical protein
LVYVALAPQEEGFQQGSYPKTFTTIIYLNNRGEQRYHWWKNHIKALTQGLTNEKPPEYGRGTNVNLKRESYLRWLTSTQIARVLHTT